METRPPSSTFMLSIKPAPAVPNSWALSRRQFSKTTSPVALARNPSFSSFLPTLNPSVAFSTMNAEIPRFPAAASVTAMATQTSA
jgi:hypothetical protein